MKNQETNARAAPIGRKYDSMPDLMRNEGVSQEIQEKTRQLMDESRIAVQLAQLRHRAGITQHQMAEKLGVSQSAISKLEAGDDDSITLCQIKQYAQATGERISMFFGKPYSHTEAVRLCANALKYNLERLTEMSNQNLERQNEIKGFLGDAFCSLFNIVATCNEKLRVDENDSIVDMKMEIVTSKSVTVPPVQREVDSGKKSVNA